MKAINTWAQEHFKKPPSVNTFSLCCYKFKLKPHLHINNIQKHWGFFSLCGLKVFCIPWLEQAVISDTLAFLIISNQCAHSPLTSNIKKALFIHTTVPHLIFSLFQTILCQHQRWLCEKIPVNNPLLKYSDQQVSHQQQCQQREKQRRAMEVPLNVSDTNELALLSDLGVCLGVWFLFNILQSMQFVYKGCLFIIIFICSPVLLHSLPDSRETERLPEVKWSYKVVEV